MKLVVLPLVALLLSIDGAPVIHRIHAQTTPLHPMAGHPSAGTQATVKPSVYPFTTTHSSPRPQTISTNYRYIIFWPADPGWRIALSVFYAISGVILILRIFLWICQCMNSRKANEKKNDPIVMSKLRVATIDGEREETYPTFVEFRRI